MHPPKSNETRSAGQGARASISGNVHILKLPYPNEDIHKSLRGREDQILQAVGIHPDARGRHQHCPLPDHEDRDPSWRWDARKARWHCSCGSGSVVDAVARVEGLSDRDAIRRVRELLGGQEIARSEPKPPPSPRCYKEATRRAAMLWGIAEPADPRHPYLQAKGVQPHALRQRHGVLFVPIQDEHGQIHNVQTIGADGRKRFLRDARVTWLFSLVGTLGEANHLVIAEGWATAATLHEEAGWPVLAAMNAGNLKPVAERARHTWPGTDIVIAADNDPAGVRFATAAAQAIGGRLAIPQFPAGTPGTDYNDLGRSLQA